MTIARELARRVLAVRFEDLPDDAVTWARTAILDTVAVTLAGANEDCTKIVQGLPGIAETEGPSLVFGSGRRVPVLDAVLINGVSAHALDYDDVAPGIGGHPSVPLVPAVIALGEDRGADGRAAITAYVAGYETESRVGRAANPTHYDKGWHPTATLGVFGTVAASAHVMGLDEDRTATALALAVSLASGVKANFGTMTKPLHVGHSVRSGVMATLLAEAGFTAGEDAFEHGHGFFEVFNGHGNYDAERIFAGWGDPFEVADPGPGLKQYPCCGSTHPAINAMLGLRRETGITPEDVETIEILTNPRRLPHTDNPDPQNGLEAKFSIQYAVARALVDGRVGFEHFEGDAFNDPAVRALLPRVRIGAHPEMAADSDHQFAAEVIVTTKAGEEKSHPEPHRIGWDPKNPPTESELRGKFEDCAKRALAGDRIRPLYDMLAAFETLPSMSALTGAMVPAEATSERKTRVG